MNQDADPSFISNNDYISAKNTRHITDNTESQQAIINIKGNQYRFDVPAIACQNKKFRIYLHANPTPIARELTFYNLNGSVFGYAQWNDQPTLADTVISAQGGLTSVLVTTLYALFTYTPAPDNSYLDFEVQGYHIEGEDQIFVCGFDINIRSTGVNDVSFIILQEAIPINAEGALYPIGSFDLLGDLFIWSTNQRNFPSVITPTITSLSNNGVALTRVTTSAAHGLVTGQEIDISLNSSVSAIAPTIISTLNNGSGDIRVTFSGAHGIPTSQYVQVKITGATSTSNANGIWTAFVVSATQIDLQNSTVGTSSAVGAAVVYLNASGRWMINVITSTTFDLINCVFVGGTSTGTITINPYGIGQVGVATYNPNSDTWLYTDLITSKEFNFNTNYQVKTYCETNNIRKSLYWVEKNNPPRVLYYKGDYVQNGFINYINPENQYEYGIIAQETRLIVAGSFVSVSFLQQLQSGGAVKSGNWRYAVNFVSDGNVETEYTLLTNPVNVYSPDFNGNPKQIDGNDPSFTTSKINQISVSNIPAGLFKYIQLAGVNYLGDGIIGYNITKVQLTDSQTSVIINHTGLEADTSIIDVGLFNVEPVPYRTAQNIDAIDNRLVLSNLTTSLVSDLSAWAQTFTHSIKRATVEGVGNVTGSYFRGEYADPLNVNYRGGYTHNETYRFSARLRFAETGQITPAFWIDDIIINTSSTNNQPSYTPSPNRRISGLPDYNLTISGIPAGANSVYAAYVEFSNIDLNYTINGKRIKDVFSEIIIERAEVVKEILASGCSALSINGAASVFRYSASASVIGEYPFISGDIRGITAVSPIYPGGGGAIRTIFKLYSPDVFCSEESLSFIAGDKILNYGNPDMVSANPANLYNNGGKTYNSTVHEYNGYTNIAPTTHSVSEMILVNTGSGGEPIAGVSYKQVLENVIPADYWSNKVGYVIKTSTSLTNISANSDYGFYYTQYFREILYTDPDDCKYGQRINTKYIPTGASLNTNGSAATVVSVSVFGGDTFTQKFILKHRAAIPASIAAGGGGGVCFYSQNRVNAQMIKRTDSPAEYSWTFPLFPSTPADWLQDTVFAQEFATYNQGYNLRNGVSSSVAFDSSSPQETELPTRIIYSEIKPQNSFSDQYRVFLPLNFKDEANAFGQITHHLNFNGELFVIQQRAVTREYFNTRGTIDVSDGSDALIGAGFVLNRDGQKVSQIGCKHVFGFVKGKSAQGNDVLYWINTELKKFCRLSKQGVQSLGDENGMQSFFANNLKWADQYDSPAEDMGIQGVWDDRNAEAIMTVRGKRVINIWDSSLNYGIGFITQYPAAGVDTFGVSGEFYTAIKAGINKQPNLFPDFWQVIPHTDTNYYNEYSVVFNEFKQKFTAFYTPTPKIYLKWKDTYLSPRPVLASDIQKIYQHNLGLYCSWYDDGITKQEEDGYWEGVVNKDPDNTHWYEAIRLSTEITPERIDFKTKTQVSFLTNSEFETVEDYSESAVKEDSTVSGVNDGDTSLMYGKWIKMKLTFKKLVYQRMFDFVMKFRTSARYYQK